MTSTEGRACKTGGVAPIRSDLPARLLAEGGLAGVGVAGPGLVLVREGVAGVAAWGRALAAPASREARVEAVAGPVLWYF